MSGPAPNQAALRRQPDQPLQQPTHQPIHQHHHHAHPHGQHQQQRYSTLIHDSELFLTKLREFKPQSLGCLEARRKSSSTLIFPLPAQACIGPYKCPMYPHEVKPMAGYWTECAGPGEPSHRPIKSNKFILLTDEAGQSAGCPFELPEYRTRVYDEKVMRKLGIIPANTTTNQPDSTNSQTTTTTSVNNTNTAPERHHRSTGPVGQPSGRDQLDEIGQTVDGRVSASHNEFIMKRRQSIELPETSSYEAAQQDAIVHSPGGQISTLAKQQHQPGSFGSLACVGVSDNSRKRLNKRTMTRDDIDLHKPRRAPNITITEPSFCQSTTNQPFNATDRTIEPISRQDSQTEKFKAMDSFDKDEAEPSSSRSVAHENWVVERPSFDQHPSFDLAEDSCTFTLQQQDSYESAEQDSLTSEPYDYLSIRQQKQRPSIIREDVDMEAETGEIEAGISTPEEQEFCFGLSTKTFHKRSYKQTCTQPVNFDQFKGSNLELISFEEENYERYYYGQEHWNYFTNDEMLGPVMLSLKQEVNNQRDHFHVLLRTVSYTLHGTIPASTICADRYDREAIVRELSEIAKLKPALMLGQLPSTPDDLLKLDHIFIKTELKVGVIHIRRGQTTSEEAILGNKDETPLFGEFLDLLGDRITLKGFDRYKGGLDTVHNLTGLESIYTMWRNIEIMFHVSTMLPHEENDPQKLQKKRHIGNDIVCVAFIEDDSEVFWPGCIKSYFLHTFIAVRTSPRPLFEGEKRKYFVSCVSRNEVQYGFKPYLVEQEEFYRSDYFREWLLVKIVNGERASYSAPKFARMQDRTRSQLLEDIITNLANHLVTGQIPKPYRRGSWRPLGHARASSPLEDSMKDYFEDYDQLAKDFCNAFCGPSRSMLCDVVFRVKDKDGSYKLVHGVRAIMAIRSRTFLEMLYGFSPPGAGGASLHNQTNLRAIEMRALSGESSSAGGTKDHEHTKGLLAKRGSVGADSSRKPAFQKSSTGEKERRQSMLPNLSKSVSQKPNYLTVPNTSGGGGGGAGVIGTGVMIKNAFNRLVSGNWSGWSGGIKGYKGEPMHIKVDQNKTKVDLNSLAICKEIAKIDSDKLSQREFEIKEFDYDTFRQTIEYIHNGQCKLSYETIPGLICAAEHYDLPDLLHACFHHANTHMRLNAAPKMMNALYQNACFYVTAMQLLESIYEFIDPLGNEFFSKTDFYELYESVFTTLLTRKSLQINELKRFQAMDGWARNQAITKLSNKQHQNQLQLQKQHSSEMQDKPDGDEEEKETTNSNLNNEIEIEYKSLMIRLNKEINIKLDKISNEDLVKIVLPTKVFSNDKIFDIMADEARMD